MFHAVGLKLMANSEMYNEVAEVLTMEENASIPGTTLRRQVAGQEAKKGDVPPRFKLCVKGN
jgi:hypothetical protein